MWYRLRYLVPKGEETVGWRGHGGRVSKNSLEVVVRGLVRGCLELVWDELSRLGENTEGGRGEKVESVVKVPAGWMSVLRIPVPVHIQGVPDFRVGRTHMTSVTSTKLYV